MTRTPAVDTSHHTETRAPPQIITRWDLDKTYLRSDFSNLSELAQRVIERPDQKRPVPGAATLLRQLGARASQVHILSGSPRQLRRAIATRLRMDGVRFDRLTLKPNASNLFRLRFSALKDQLGYKLHALLSARYDEQERGSAAPTLEILVGDDSEADAFVYSLYADICTGAIGVKDLACILADGNTYPDVRQEILRLANGLTPSVQDVRFLILIHLDRQTPPSHFSAFSPRLVPFHNYLQASLLLVHHGVLDAAAFYELAQEMALCYRTSVTAIAASYRDLLRRIDLPAFSFRQAPAPPEETSLELTGLQPELVHVAEQTAASPPFAAGPRDGDSRARPISNSSAIEPLDYRAMARAHRGGKNRR